MSTGTGARPGTGWRRSSSLADSPQSGRKWKLVSRRPARDDEAARRTPGPVARPAAGTVRTRVGARAPGKWTPAQIVEQLALGLNLSGETFVRAAIMRRCHGGRGPSSRNSCQAVYFRVSLFPPGRKAPERATARARGRPPRSRRQAIFLSGGWRRGTKSTARSYAGAARSTCS